MSDLGRIVVTNTPELFGAAISAAEALLRAGNIVAVPTETVYGLAANAFNETAVNKIFEIKGRPANNPIIVHITGMEMATKCVGHWPTQAEKLARAFWPGPLTLVLPRSEMIPDIVTAGGSTVGVRWPSHPFMQALIGACGFPLAAPSANRSNQLSPTTAAHVSESLGAAVPLIVDGGPARVGIESTVLDLTESPPRVLRPGMIHNESLTAVIGDLAMGPPKTGASLRSPGMLPKHYAPKANLRLWKWENESELSRRIAGLGGNPEKIHVIAHARVPMGLDAARVCIIPHDAEAFARAIYAELHRCDRAGAEWIIVEMPPDTPEWEGILDRLKRAGA